MTRALPTTPQAERIHTLFDQAVAEHPQQAELLRAMERTIVQQPDDSGPGFPEPLEPQVQQIVAGVLKLGPIEKRKLRKTLRET